MVHSGKYLSFPFLFSNYPVSYKNIKVANFPYSSPQKGERGSVVETFCIAIEKILQLRVLPIWSISHPITFNVSEEEPCPLTITLEAYCLDLGKPAFVLSPVVTKPRGPEHL